LTSDVAERAAAPGLLAPVDSTARQIVGSFNFAAHNCFACGQLNVHGLRLVLHAAEGRCWTETSLSSMFEGWAGMTHGGIVSAILDEVMAWSLAGAGRFGFTARLEVDFKRPVPIDTPIRAEGWTSERRRRRFDTRGQLTDAASGVLLAEARAIYLAVPQEQDAALRARYDVRVVPRDAS